MPVSERAKQFMPFSALKGLEEAIAEKERLRRLTPRIELSDDAAERLDRRLCALAKGDTVVLKYYHEGEYLTATGRITRLDKTFRTLTLGEDIVVAFDDIYGVGENFRQVR